MALLLGRWIFIVASMVAFGSALFPFYAYPHGERPRGARLTRPLILVGAVLALVAAAAWLVLEIIDFGGDAPETFASTASDVLFATGFGQVWLIRLAASIALVALAAMWPAPAALLALAAVVLGGEAWIGHPAVGGTIHCLVHSLHLIPAGAWLGGLLPLSLVLAQSGATPREVERTTFALTRFSAVGMASVGLILASGICNVAFVIGRIPNFTNAYGQTLAAKLALFLVLLAIAGFNRFKLLPQLRQDGATQPSALRTFSRTVLAEQMLGLALLLVASMLGAADPSV